MISDDRVEMDFGGGPCICTARCGGSFLVLLLA